MPTDDPRFLGALRAARRAAETDLKPARLSYECGRIAAREGLSLEDAVALAAHAESWRAKIASMH